MCDHEMTTINDSSASHAARLMWDHDCGALPVVHDDGTLASMITDRDICMAALTQGQPLSSLLVNSAMAKHVLPARPDQPLTEAETLMAKVKVRRLPVRDASNRPIGVISLTDLACDAARMDDGCRHAMVRVGFTLAAIAQSHARERAAQIVPPQGQFQSEGPAPGAAAR
jgi:CBS-domain-containing membrane protein